MRILSCPLTVSLSLPLPALREERTGGKQQAANWLLAASFCLLAKELRNNLRDRAGAARVSAFANREPQALFHRHRRDQFDHQAHVVARHHHLRARRQLRYSGHVRRSQIKLRTVSFEERRMSAAFFLRQDVYLRL